MKCAHRIKIDIVINARGPFTSNAGTPWAPGGEIRTAGIYWWEQPALQLM